MQNGDIFLVKEGIIINTCVRIPGLELSQANWACDDPIWSFMI